MRLFLRDSLNEEPSRETRALYQQLTQQSATLHVPPPVLASSSTTIIEPEPVGGAMLLSSRLYIERTTDEAVRSALRRGDGLILLKGARQTGKSSLLARELAAARARGARVLVTDFQSLAGVISSTDTLLFGIANQLARRLQVPLDWDPGSPPGENLESWLTRAVLGEEGTPVVWGLDEMDSLFHSPAGNEVFALFRSWYNARAMEPERVWGRLSVILCYATEAHLFISDVNQSPFNVGSRFTLEDFIPEQVEDLNERYGRPLRGSRNLTRLCTVVGGHPFLTQGALSALSTGRYSLEEIERVGLRDDETIFSQHLNRLVQVISADAEMVAAVCTFADTQKPPSARLFFRLRSAGVLLGGTPHEAQFRCGLYAQFLPRRLGQTIP
jgi:hypothetical protein